jgi:hypothetical protein
VHRLYSTSRSKHLHGRAVFHYKNQSMIIRKTEIISCLLPRVDDVHGVRPTGRGRDVLRRRRRQPGPSLCTFSAQPHTMRHIPRNTLKGMSIELGKALREGPATKPPAKWKYAPTIQMWSKSPVLVQMETALV